MVAFFQVVYTNVRKVADDRLCPVCGEEAPGSDAIKLKTVQ
jgi:hypothetical protein